MSMGIQTGQAENNQALQKYFSIGTGSLNYPCIIWSWWTISWSLFHKRHIYTFRFLCSLLFHHCMVHIAMMNSHCRVVSLWLGLSLQWVWWNGSWQNYSRANQAIISMESQDCPAGIWTDLLSDNRVLVLGLWIGGAIFYLKGKFSNKA